MIKICYSQESRQKNFQEGSATEKDQKIAKKIRKIAILSLFRGGGGNGKKTKKRPKNSKKN